MQKRNSSDYLTLNIYISRKELPVRDQVIIYKMAESDLNRHLVYCQKAHKTNS